MRLARSLAAPAVRIYVTACLVAAAALSPPALAFVPALLAAVYLFFWWRPFHVATSLIADYFALIAIPVLLSQEVPPQLAWLFGLPLLVAITRDLETAVEAFTRESTARRRVPTRTGIAMLLIALAGGFASLLFGSLALLIESLVAIAYLGTLFAIAFRKIPLKPLEETAVDQRVVAGSRAEVSIALESKTGMGGGTVFLDSPHPWVKVPEAFPLSEKNPSFSMTFTPPLSGPSSIVVTGYVTDRWGLTQTRFTMEPVRLHVIPRARYASWLAKRYLAEGRGGTLPLLSNVGNVRILYGLRSGIEYYGSQLYQPGDSLKNIDWKHSIKYNKLISKEFAELRGQPAILLVNLAVGDAEEADKQSYNIVMAALSLAREQIPTALAAYDERGVQLVTPLLQPRVLVARALDVTEDIRTIGKPTRYLEPADVVRLRANIRRLQSVESDPAQALARLLQLEYQSLKVLAVGHPVAKALIAAFDKAGDQASVVVVSPLNHDAEAVMFNTVVYEKKGNAVLVV